MKGAPELQAAEAALARIPDAWTEAGLAAAVERRAVLLTAARLLTEQADRARATAECAAVSIAAGDFEAIDELVAAQGELLAVDRAQAALPPVELDADAVHAALHAARTELDAADRRLALTPLDFDVDMANWLQSSRTRGNIYTPPVQTDRDRELSAQAAVLADRVGQAWAGSRAWRSDVDRRVGDPVDLLAAAAGHLAAADALAADVAALNAEIEQANADRQDADLTWRHPMHAEGVVL